MKSLVTLVVLMSVVRIASGQEVGEGLRQAATFYASFDAHVAADFGPGDLSLWTRYDHETRRGEYIREHRYDDKIFRIAAGKGVQGGALECLDVMPRRGRIYFPMQGKLAFQPDGWSGACSFWINTDPNTMLKTQFCDPVQITNRGAHDGGLWIDFPNVKPRDLRLGVFNGLAAGEKAVAESSPDATLVTVKRIGFKAGRWHHVAFTWQNFDTGQPNGQAALYIDGKPQGAIQDRNLHMDWNVDQAGIYTAVSLIGMMDELVLFGRTLSQDEVGYLFEHPKLFQGLSGKPANDTAQLDADAEVLRPEILQQIATTWSTRPAAERAIAQLCQLPRQQNPPKAPVFPFDARTAAEYQRAYAHWSQLPVAWTNAAGIEFRLIPPGTFVAGSPESEAGRSTAFDETSQTITLTRPFYLASHETTLAQFRAFVQAENFVTDGERGGGGNAHDAQADWKHRPGTSWKHPGFAGPYEPADTHPVVHVSHTDSRAFCRWLADRAKLAGGSVQYDLPTECQWEWACRAGAASRYWWGAEVDNTGQRLNAGDQALKVTHPEWPRETMPMHDGHAFPAPVGSYRANGFGLHDMLGNVWEFCSTRFGPYPQEPALDPSDLSDGRGFAVRGGGWSNTPGDVRCATRNADPPHFCHSNLGFRVSLQLSPIAQSAQRDLR